MTGVAKHFSSPAFHIERPTMLNRQLVLLLDGTWNRREDSTNVARTRLLVAGDAHQKVYYDEGVGTAKGEEFKGGALGSGLTQKVLAAYLWLIENYAGDPNLQMPVDEIYILGFSRGAYAARSLVGLLAISGILRRNAHANVREAFELSRTPFMHPDVPAAKAFRARNSLLPTVNFLGVWDTVESLGLPRIRNPLCRPAPSIATRAEHKVNMLPRIVRHARHALALDEYRWIFDALLWQSFEADTTLEQRWFVGAHANVGGGYANDLLYLRPLQWMLGEARIAGLRLRTLDEELPAGFYTCAPRNSLDEAMLGAYYLSQWGKPLPRNPSRWFDAEQFIDHTVLRHWLWNPTYRPLALLTRIPNPRPSRPKRWSVSDEDLTDLLGLNPQQYSKQKMAYRLEVVG